MNVTYEVVDLIHHQCIKVDFCCPDMETLWGDVVIFCQYDQPGVGIRDHMWNLIYIDYCPWCGKPITFVK